MNISSVKMTLQKPIKRIFPLALGTIVLLGCETPANKVKDYCEITNRTQDEHTELLEGKYYNGSERMVETQALLDSLVYIDLLNSSELGNDSSVIAEFNKISVMNRYTNPDIENIITSSGISAKDFRMIQAKNSPVNKQFHLDKLIFGNFFKEKGLMQGTFLKRFEAVSNFLNPSKSIEGKEIDN